MRDNYAASGNNPSYRPGNWLKTQQAQVESIKGRNGGTYVVKELVSEIELEAGIPACKIVKGRGIAGTYEHGNPWFVAADVCAGLKISNEQTRRLDSDERGLHLAQTPGGRQQVTVVNESGLYNLVLGSRKPEAKKFKKWVTSEVLPAVAYFLLTP